MATILIIEDNTEIRENTAELLELEGYSVIVAQNGRLGYETAVLKEPHVIICDIMMPVMNGYEVLQELKKNESTANIPFVFVTASTEKKEIQMAMDMGANHYVSKPYDVEQLFEILNTILSDK